MYNTLIVAHLVISFLLIFVILFQRTGADGLSGLSGGSIGGNNLVSPKSTASFLHKLTVGLIAAFMINAIVLGNLSNFDPTKSKIVDESLKEASGTTVPKE